MELLKRKLQEVGVEVHRPHHRLQPPSQAHSTAKENGGSEVMLRAIVATQVGRSAGTTCCPVFPPSATERI